MLGYCDHALRLWWPGRDICTATSVRLDPTRHASRHPNAHKARMVLRGLAALHSPLRALVVSVARHSVPGVWASHAVSNKSTNSALTGAMAIVRKRGLEDMPTRCFHAESR